MTVVSLRSPLSRRPLLLDLFCGAGGAARGYRDAGFDIVGVDIEKQPRYPYKFYQVDAVKYLHDLIDCGEIHFVDAIHASPPCQGYSTTRGLHPDREYPMLIEPVRDALKASGKPYVIENVPGAPLIDPVVLCGSHFGLTAWWGNNGRVGLRRHRLFETSFPVADPGKHDHSLRAITVTGHGGPTMLANPNGTPRLRGKGYSAASREAMGIHWMKRPELSESIPPAYTRYVGKHLLEALTRKVAA